MRVQPKPWIGVLIFVLYLVVFYGVWAINGIDYTRIGESADTLFRWYFMPLFAGAILLVVATSILGWWKASLFEKQPAKRWPLVSALVVVVVAVLIFATKDVSEVEPMAWVWLVLGSLLVGFSEEMVTRGVLVVGLRGRYKEATVWLLSTLMFGLLHLPNAVFGAGGAAVFQVFTAAAAGTVFYIARRCSGTLLVPIALHALWDFASFAGVATPQSTTMASLGLGVNFVMAAVLIFFVLRETRGQKVPQYGTTATPSQT